MKKQINKLNLILLAFITIVFLVYGLFIWILDKDSVMHVYNNPVLTDGAIYKEMAAGDTISFNLLASKEQAVSGITILPVNVSAGGKGSINVRIDQSGGNTAFTSIRENEIKVGKWNRIPIELSLNPNQTTKVTFTFVDCNPYFMYAPKNNITDSDISVGTYLNATSSNDFIAMLVKYAVLLIAYSIILFMLLTESCGLIGKVGNDLFLVFVFVFVCVGIYSAAYKNGIFITADSAGYLREAANLRAGNGFSYDGLAGYSSWFANWPILYPVMIAAIMLVSGLDAYLSSKIVTAILVLAIIVVLRIRFGKKAWLYSVALLNLGFVQLSYYTWSEIPFILFLMLFAFKLGDIVGAVGEDTVSKTDYVLLGLWGVLTFLTRYFGIYIWIVVGGYIVILLFKRIKSKEKVYFWTGIKLTITAFVSGTLSLGYMFLNKIMNGMPSGVSRGAWWDDYKILTVDLINSLITEVFNVFHVDCSEILGIFGIWPKVIFAVIILGTVVFLVIRGLCKTGGLFTSWGALLILGGSYYLIFTVIRYFSSMDTFYFRFFEPASFIITLGIVGLILEYVKRKNSENTDNGKKYIWVRTIGVIVTVLMAVGIADYLTDGLTLTKFNYYDVAKEEWNLAYKEIPVHSVVIFSDLDYRSEYYRPDVIFDKMTTEDTAETLKTRFYGSDTLIIQREYAESMVECGEYEESVTKLLSEALDAESDGKYLHIALRGN